MRMKKNSFLLSLIFTFILFLNLKVNADSIGYYLSNAELNYNYDSVPSVINVKRGDYIYVTAIINDVTGSSLTLKNGRVTVRWDNSYLELVPTNNLYYNLEKSSFSNLLVAENSRTNNKITLDYTSNELIKQGINKLMEFKFRVLNNSKTGVTKIYEMDGETSVNCLQDDKEILCGNSYNSELKYNIESSEINTLSSIKIDGKQIDNFNENISEYSLEVDSSKKSINIEALKKDDKESIGGDIGTRSLEYGLNIFNIDVISESGDKRTYVIRVTRKDDRSTDNTLKNIKLSDGIIQFKTDITDYDIEVRNEVEKITIIATLNDAKAKFKEDFSKKEIELIEGINKVLITVIAENGNEKVYTIKITRKLSSNNTLKMLTVNNQPIKLNKNDFLYYFTVGNEIDRVDINAIATDSNAVVKIDDINNLEIGENEIGISVTAPNGDVVNYTVIVTREQLLSNNAKLSKLEVVGYKINFSEDITYYDLKIKDEDSLDLIYETADDNATVTVEGNKNLVNGSIIKINVKAEDNSIVRYFINIEKGSKQSNLIWIILIPLIIILMIMLIVLMSKNKKKKNKLSKVNNEQKNEVASNNVIDKFDNSDENNSLENEDIKDNNIDEDVPMVDLEKTIFVKDLNPVIEENQEKEIKEEKTVNEEEKKNVTKKTIDLE